MNEVAGSAGIVQLERRLLQAMTPREEILESYLF